MFQNGNPEGGKAKLKPIAQNMKNASIHAWVWSAGVAVSTLFFITVLGGWMMSVGNGAECCCSSGQRKTLTPAPLTSCLNICGEGKVSHVADMLRMT